jgi:hypothetical protein
MWGYEAAVGPASRQAFGKASVRWHNPTLWPCLAQRERDELVLGAQPCASVRAPGRSVHFDPRFTVEACVPPVQVVWVVDVLTWTVLVPMLLDTEDEEKRAYWRSVLFTFTSYNVGCCRQRCSQWE